MTEKKRQNFDVTPEQEAELDRLRLLLDAPSIKDAILRATRVVNIVAHEIHQGRVLLLRGPQGEMERLILPELMPPPADRWTYLVERPHPWRRQLYVKGRRLPAYRVWMDMRVNQMTPEQATDNWDLPLAAIEEIIRYCESNRELLEMEAAEERVLLARKGVTVETADR